MGGVGVPVAPVTGGGPRGVLVVLGGRLASEREPPPAEEEEGRTQTSGNRLKVTSLPVCVRVILKSVI